MNAKVELQGLKELAANLGGLKKSTRNRILKPAINKALEPVKKACELNVAAHLGIAMAAGSRVIGKKVYVSKRSGAVGGLVGAVVGGPMDGIVVQKDGAIVFQKISKILQFIEEGRPAEVAQGKHGFKSGGAGRAGVAGRFYGRSVRAAKGFHPLKNAWASTKATAEQIVAREIGLNALKLMSKGQYK
jgi:hypothetical protein